jgi:hypothetical protein
MGRILRGVLLVVFVAPACDGQVETARHDLRGARRATNGEPSPTPPRGLSTLEIIEEALRRNKIAQTALPDYLAFAHLESNFDPHVVSPVGAVGLFQLMPATALSLADTHPAVARERVVIYNPTWRSGRRLLFAGPARRYPMRVLRWYGAHLKKFLQRAGPEQLVAADSRFDPQVNALLATYHVDRLRKRYFRRYRCYRSKGRKICGNFGGRHATMMAAACFHLGTPSVARAIAETGARSFQAYIRATLRSKKRSQRDNGRYLRRLSRLARTYRRLASGGRPQREAVARAFRDPAIAQNLFRTHPVAR